MADWTKFRDRSRPMLASSSRARWILAAASCAVIGFLLRLADIGSEAPPPLAPVARAASQRTGGDTASGDRGGARVACDAPAPSDAEFPTILGPGFHPDRPSALSAHRAQRALARRTLRNARRVARLRAKRN